MNLGKVMARKKSGKVEVKTENDLGQFLSGNVEVKSEVKPKTKRKVNAEVKTEVTPQVISQVTFTKEMLTELGFELEVLPSGQKTNLSHKHKYIINGFNPLFFRGSYTHTIHYAPDKIYPSIRSIEFV